MLDILSNCMFKMFQFHFFAPLNRVSKKAYAKSVNLFLGGSTLEPLFINDSKELNLMEIGSPSKLKSIGIRAVAI